VAVALPLLTAAGTLAVGPAPAAGVAATSAAAVCSPALAPGQPAPDEPWPQARYDLAAVHRISQGSGVTVAVLDSGVDPTHPQLAGAVRGGGDPLSGSGNGLEDCVGHGTAVASIIAARPVPGIAFRGIAPQATILSIRVGDRRSTEDGYVGSGDVTALVAGIQAAVAAQPRPAVLNLSISTTTDSPALRDAIRAALDADIVVVAAVGNRADQGNPTPYPAAYDGVLGVGAIGSTGVRYGPSQVGRYVDLVAPGEQVLAAAPLAGHIVASGTSFAVPFVAGTAALIRARWPELNRTEVVRRLLATADPPAGGQPSLDYGYGVVNPLRALTELVPPAAGAAGGPPASPPRPPARPGTCSRWPRRCCWRRSGSPPWPASPRSAGAVVGARAASTCRPRPPTTGRACSTTSGRRPRPANPVASKSVGRQWAPSSASPGRSSMGPMSVGPVVAEPRGPHGVWLNAERADGSHPPALSGDVPVSPPRSSGRRACRRCRRCRRPARDRR
jgi:membrane-anchored mycosin MYCP